MKIFSSTQIKRIDAYTIEHEPIASVDLMERAAEALFDAITSIYPYGHRFLVFCGPGNNGGDGLAVARLLACQGKCVSVYLLQGIECFSPDALVNYKRLEKSSCVSIKVVTRIEDLPELLPNDIVLDAMFGSGLSRPLTGFPQEVVNFINESRVEVVAIDVPSGLPGEDCARFSSEGIIRAARTLTLQFPKLSFLFPENEQFVGRFSVLPIGLHPTALSSTHTLYNYITDSDLRPLVLPRRIFSHKGTFGNLLLIAGNRGMMGAAVLASRAAYRAGAGLITTHVPAGQGSIIQIASPESLVSEDVDADCFSDVGELGRFDAVVVGPGIGTHPKSTSALRQLLGEVAVPLVLDADAINIIAAERRMVEMLPHDTVLTPHPKELERLIGSWSNSFNRLEKQQAFAMKHKVVLLCKGAYTTIALPNGELFFNSTGNPGMASGGTGDVLAGIVGGLLAQGYSSANAATLGVYLHGLAGDIASQEMGEHSVIASDLVSFLGKAWLNLLK